MNSVKIISLLIVFSMGVLVQGIANATTISEYDAMDDDRGSEVISKALQDNIDATVKGSGSRELTQCMVDHFLKLDDALEIDAPVGLIAIGKQLQTQRKLNKSDTVHVEDVVRAVYAWWLENNCLKKYPLKPEDQ